MSGTNENVGANPVGVVLKICHRLTIKQEKLIPTAQEPVRSPPFGRKISFVC